MVRENIYFESQVHCTAHLELDEIQNYLWPVDGSLEPPPLLPRLRDAVGPPWPRRTGYGEMRYESYDHVI